MHCYLFLHILLCSLIYLFSLLVTLLLLSYSALYFSLLSPHISFFLMWCIFDFCESLSVPLLYFSSSPFCSKHGEHCWETWRTKPSLFNRLYNACSFPPPPSSHQATRRDSVETETNYKLLLNIWCHLIYLSGFASYSTVQCRNSLRIYTA
jgi:hypothetical protein